MLIEDLKAMASLTSGKQREYFEAMLQGAHTVYCKPMSEVLPEKLLKRVKQVKIEKKQCYKNSTLICMVDAEINYVEGKMECLGIPIEHAWNEYKGQYFDATREIALKEEVQGREYLALGTFDSDDVLGVIMKREYYGGILLEKYLQSKSTTLLKK